jgi:IclR family pca regulon transcriptional regulator
LAGVDLVRRGPNTIVAKSQLLAELRRIRQAGMAVNNEELAYGLRSIAAPIFDQDGRATAALNLAVHSSMVSMEDLLARLSQPLRQTASAISTRLGHRPEEAQVAN